MFHQSLQDARVDQRRPLRILSPEKERRGGLLVGDLEKNHGDLVDYLLIFTQTFFCQGCVCVCVCGKRFKNRVGSLLLVCNDISLYFVYIFLSISLLRAVGNLLLFFLICYFEYLCLTVAVRQKNG